MGSHEDKVEGKTEQATGKVKEMAGETFNDPDLAAEGRVEQGKGELREATGDAKNAASRAKNALKNALD